MPVPTRIVAILGAGGQLGQDLCPLLEGAVRLSHAEIELTDAQSVREAIGAHQPGIVINLAAYNLVDRCEEQAATAFEVNALGVRHVALACRELGCRLVHISTDYVFGLDEQRHTPYRESDGPGPVSVYGASKLAGEHFVRALCPDHLVVRTCGLYGRAGARGKGGNFVKTMLRLADEKPEVRVVNDQVCTPSFTKDVAAALAFLAGHAVRGLMHVTNGGECTWYEFAREVFRITGRETPLYPITSEEFAARARRPAYSTLSTALYESLGGPAMRPWPEALRDYLAATP